jgi:hypothetical protein
MRVESANYLVLAVFAVFSQAWAISLIGLAVFLGSVWLDTRASRNNRAWGNYLTRDSGDRTVRIVPDLSRRLDGSDPLLVPRVYLDRLSDAEMDALLARQEAPLSRWPLPLALAVLFALTILGVKLTPPSLAPLVYVAGMLCLWPLIVWHYRRLDAQADAKAVQATGDPATYIQALRNADRLMQEIPRRHRMSTWWLFPASLESRIAAITAANPPARDSG